MDRLLFFFVLLPLVELALLTSLSHYTSLSFTILFIIVTGLVGTWLARWQGFNTYRRVQQELAAGRAPQDSLAYGVLILLGGVLLITPGVLTDLIGILLLLPPTRALARVWLMKWVQRNFRVQTFVSATRGEGPLDPQRPHDAQVVDTWATESAGTASPRSLDPPE
jgi:UPF0716 protein FxsA